MNAIALVPAVEDEEEDEQLDELPSRTSFFAEGERADEIVCADVYRIYIKSSLAHGLATHRDTIVRAAPLERPDIEESKPMPEQKSRATSPFASELAKAHAALSRALERAPTVPELAERLGPDANASYVRQVALRAGLALTRLRAPAGTASRKSAPPPKKTAEGLTRAAADEDASPASNGVHTSLAIMALQGERAKVAAELAAIDSVIDRLRR